MVDHPVVVVDGPGVVVKESRVSVDRSGVIVIESVAVVNGSGVVVEESVAIVNESVILVNGFGVIVKESGVIVNGSGVLANEKGVWDEVCRVNYIISTAASQDSTFDEKSIYTCPPKEGNATFYLPMIIRRSEYYA
ncbi:hypothetical protein N6H18_07665 [Reichenbachiella agarivorans]|uniref:Dynactin subunit 6 n=1 Tax=Reichenbachiella agarivorans TaxID=2979464 RepID=A0ABY6CV91_9BACT|nr:hypothetical protein [Reichenbachiella agarivorans]UXP33824.1 hypothetical protein N6H18_07665 [Reichenbachiella agarivorans]